MQQDEAQPDYDFILNSGQQPKKSIIPTGGNKKQRLLLVFVGGAILLTLILIIFSLIFGGGGSDQALQLAQKNTELIRIAEIGTEKAKDSTAKNLAITTKLTFQSAEPQILKLANQKAGSKKLSAGKNEATDKALTDAEQNNRFDEVFIEKINIEVKAYLTLLKSVYDKASSKNKQILDDIYSRVSGLAPPQQTP